MGKYNRVLPRQLLHGPSVPVFRMAEQEYCEMKVDLELRHPEIEEQFRELPEAAEQIEALERGKEFHKEAASEAVPVPAEDLPRMILSRQPFTLVEFPLRGHFGKLPLIGRADALHFNGKGASWIVEFKVVKGRPYVSEWVDAQLRLYGYLLKQDKTFDAQQVFLVCVYVDAEVRKKIDAIDEDRAVRLVRMVCEETPESFTGHRTWKKKL